MLPPTVRLRTVRRSREPLACLPLHRAVRAGWRPGLGVASGNSWALWETGRRRVHLRLRAHRDMERSEPRRHETPDRGHPEESRVQAALRETRAPLAQDRTDPGAGDRATPAWQFPRFRSRAKS